MEIEVTVISTAEYQRLKRLEAAALDLSRLFIPKVNIGASAIAAEGFAAWNKFEQAASEIRRTNEQ